MGLELLLVFDKFGAVLWSREERAAAAGAWQALNKLISTVLLEARAGGSTESTVDGYLCQWTLLNEHGLVVAAVHGKAVHLPYVPELMSKVALSFVSTHGTALASAAAVGRPDGLSFDS